MNNDSGGRGPAHAGRAPIRDEGGVQESKQVGPTDSSQAINSRENGRTDGVPLSHSHTAAHTQAHTATQTRLTHAGARAPVPPRTRACRNIFFLVCFLLHFVILYPSVMTATPVDGALVPPEGSFSLRVRFTLAAFLGTGLGMLWTFLVRSMSLTATIDKVFNLSYLVATGIFVIHAIILAAAGVWSLACVLLAVAVADALWRHRARERIVFVAEFLDVIWTAVSCYGNLALIIICAAVLQFVFVYLFSAAVTHVLMSSTSHAQAGFAIVCLLLSLRWTTGVIKHTITYVTAFCVTSWLAVCAELASSAEQEETARADLRQRAQSLTRIADDDEDTQLDHLAAGDAAQEPDMSDITLEDLGLSTPATRRPGASSTNGAPPGTNGASASNHATASRPAPALALRTDVPPAPQAGATSDRRVVEVSSTQLPEPFTVLRHALTTALGSIAAGSILGVVSPVAWACRRGARHMARVGRPDGIVSRTGAGAYRVADAYLRLSHKYSYVLVSTQGRGWFNSAGHTWRLMMRSGADALIDDDVTDRLLLFGCYACGGILSLLLGTTLDTDTGTWLLAAFLVFWFGFLGVALPLTVIEASVSALFVSFAQVPEVLALAHPLIHHRFLRLSELYLLTRKHIVTPQADILPDRV